VGLFGCCISQILHGIEVPSKPIDQIALRGRAGRVLRSAFGLGNPEASLGA